MRAAMAAAEVGDDVLDRDPTMRELEERIAEILGTEDALWTPSGSMANLIALMHHLDRGDAFLAPAGAHVLDAELGTAAWLAGGMPRPLEHDAGPGKVSPDAIRRAAGAPGPYFTLRTTLLCLENTHNSAGGTVTAPDEHASLAAAARAAKLRVHLDGARLWHAAVALGVPPRTLTVGADTVQVCLSKGLGAPMGSMVAGSAEFIEEARRLRKMLGGGVRQGGVVAAAGLVALDRVDRLAEDHERARELAAGLRERGWQVGVPETNIVLVSVADLGGTLYRLESAGVRATPMAGQVRFVTHADVTDADIAAALERIGPVETSNGVPQPRNRVRRGVGPAPVRPAGW
jgi:threonine aldolase